MRFGYNDTCLEHDPGDRHPESPQRLAAIRQGLTGRHGVEYVQAGPATLGEVEAVHDPAYVDEIREFCAAGGGNWDPDTVAVEATWDAALASAGLAAWAAETAIDGAAGRETPFALGRPPGHHAVADDAMGFCFINNAAVAAERALSAGADRIAVLDWDVHHGNGTQNIFADREDVCYLSVHEADIYPGTGGVDVVGEGDGEATTVNVPLPSGAGDAAYRLVFDEVFAPVVERFDPDLLLVSAGFDAHRNDPISRMHVTTEGYGLLTERARSMAAGAGAAVAFVLEGGYGLDTLADGVGAVHETFDGRTPAVDTDSPDPDVRDLVAEVRVVYGIGSK
jgi:acetoin utilization deacetylase AcuC-like enzyme